MRKIIIAAIAVLGLTAASSHALEPGDTGTGTSGDRARTAGLGGSPGFNASTNAGGNVIYSAPNRPTVSGASSSAGKGKGGPLGNGDFTGVGGQGKEGSNPVGNSYGPQSP